LWRFSGGGGPNLGPGGGGGNGRGGGKIFAPPRGRRKWMRRRARGGGAQGIPGKRGEKKIPARKGGGAPPWAPRGKSFFPPTPFRAGGRRGGGWAFWCARDAGKKKGRPRAPPGAAGAFFNPQKGRSAGDPLGKGGGADKKTRAAPGTPRAGGGGEKKKQVFEARFIPPGGPHFPKCRGGGGPRFGGKNSGEAPPTSEISPLQAPRRGKIIFPFGGKPSFRGPKKGPKTGQFFPAAPLGGGLGRGPSQPPNKSPGLGGEKRPFQKNPGAG